MVQLFRSYAMVIQKACCPCYAQVYTRHFSSIGKEVSDLKEGVWELFFLL